MSNSKMSFAEVLSQVEVMTSGLKNNATRAAKRGLDTTFVERMEALYQEVQNLNNEQERLKADLKSKTEALNEKIATLEAQYREAKKVVKLEFEQSQWIGFGLKDKH